MDYQTLRLYGNIGCGVSSWAIKKLGTVRVTKIGPTSLAKINISEPRFESYDPWDMANLPASVL